MSTLLSHHVVRTPAGRVLWSTELYEAMSRTAAEVGGVAAANFFEGRCPVCLYGIAAVAGYLPHDYTDASMWQVVVEAAPRPGMQGYRPPGPLGYSVTQTDRAIRAVQRERNVSISINTRVPLDAVLEELDIQVVPRTIVVEVRRATAAAA